MIEIVTLIFLFFILTPGILWSYPKKTNKYSIALVHAGVFAFIWHFIHKQFNNTPFREGMDNNQIRFTLSKSLYTDANISKIKGQFKKYDNNKKLLLNRKTKNTFAVIHADGSVDSMDITQLDIDNLTNIRKFIREHK